MTDWTKPIFEEASGKPAKFIGYSSQGAAVIEYCENLYFVNADSGIRFANQQTGEPCKKQLKFVNATYRYEPFSSYEEVVPFIGAEIENTCELATYQILGVFIGYETWSVAVGKFGIVTYYVMPSRLSNVYIFKDSKEPVGKKVLKA